ncbi:MAG: glycosyltransferase [Candidatus Acidiferrales bacterium]
MKAPLITVLIDTYNYGHFIEEAVNSVLTQDFPADQMEILVVDDGSTDNTADRLRKYAPRVRYLYKPNGGQASAFNYGFQHSTGELIALLDADDLWEPNKLSRVAYVYAMHPESVMIYHNYIYWDPDVGSTWPGYFSEMSGELSKDAKKMLRYMIAPTSSTVFTRNAVDLLFPVPTAVTIQADVFLDALAIFLGPVTAIPECLMRYRVHGQNLFYSRGGAPAERKQIQKRIETRQACIDEMRAWLLERGWDTSDPCLRAYFRQWELLQEKDGFQLSSPDRTRFAYHLSRYPVTYAAIMSPQHILYSWITVFAALILGYRHLDKLEGVRTRFKRVRESLGRLLRPSSRDRLSGSA